MRELNELELAATTGGVIDPRHGTDQEMPGLPPLDPNYFPPLIPPPIN